MQAILFDLDGTLLPMDEKKFLNSYLYHFAAMCTRKNLDQKLMIDCLLSGMQRMIEGGGETTNENRFWNEFFTKAGMELSSDRSTFTEFYNREFANVKSSVRRDPAAAECITAAKRKGLRVILATNPMFPRVATLTRIGWAGLCESDFELISTYEDFCFTKPNLNYYKEIFSKTQLDPAQCVMVGNDVLEDMCAAKLGMDSFLVTDCIINSTNEDISRYKSGNLLDCLAFIDGIRV